jgi:hypothetical protein
MARSVSQKKRRRGRPVTGNKPVVTARISKEAIKVLDNWAKSKGITRGEAIRLLVEVGLKKRKA